MQLDVRRAFVVPVRRLPLMRMRPWVPREWICLPQCRMRPKKTPLWGPRPPNTMTDCPTVEEPNLPALRPDSLGEDAVAGDAGAVGDGDKASLFLRHHEVNARFVLRVRHGTGHDDSPQAESMGLLTWLLEHLQEADHEQRAIAPPQACALCAFRQRKLLQDPRAARFSLKTLSSEGAQALRSRAYCWENCARTSSTGVPDHWTVRRPGLDTDSLFPNAAP